MELNKLKPPVDVSIEVIRYPQPYLDVLLLSPRASILDLNQLRPYVDSIKIGNDFAEGLLCRIESGAQDVTTLAQVVGAHYENLGMQVSIVVTAAND